MPELPDIELYLEALRPRVCGAALRGVCLASPFLLRSVEPPLAAVRNKTIVSCSRLGKRLVFALEDELYLVLHLMIAGRLSWKTSACQIPARIGLAAFDFDHGTLLLRESSRKKRASLFVVQGAASLAAHDRGGLEPLDCTFDAFHAALTRENHTLKRALTDPRLFSGIGNAYSDEILHRARLSPLKWTLRLDQGEALRLYHACVDVLSEWVARLRAETGGAFPEKVTAFREGMAVHGRYGQPCPVCGAPVQRIRRAENEVNYCAPCQTGGKLLADRGLSRLLKEDWPRTLDELERLSLKSRSRTP